VLFRSDDEDPDSDQDDADVKTHSAFNIGRWSTRTRNVDCSPETRPTDESDWKSIALPESEWNSSGTLHVDARGVNKDYIVQSGRDGENTEYMWSYAEGVATETPKTRRTVKNEIDAVTRQCPGARRREGLIDFGSR
jgi:hypothetical protein